MITEAEFETILQHTKNYIEVRRHTYERAHVEMLDAKVALCLAQQHLERAEHQCQCAFNELHRLEASVGSLHERFNITDVEAFDPYIMEATDEEIEAQAVRLITQVHEDKNRKLNKEIESLSQFEACHCDL